MPTVQILTKNNESSIEKTLKSLKDLEFNIIIGDLGSRDKTLEICSKFGAEIIKLNWKEDYSKARNELIREGFNLYIEPWEILFSGHNIIKNSKDPISFYILQNKIVSKEIRFWKDTKFQNPIYETIVDKKAKCFPEVVVVSNKSPNKRIERIELSKKWLNNKPTNPEPYYYLACSYLANKQLKEFMSVAEQYLIMDRKFSISHVLIYYYMSQVEAHMGKLKEAAEHILTCIGLHPTFAEFWCLLGDIFYKQKKYDKAKEMYDNALILGKRRIKNDEFSIEIVKYEEYPLKMIENIKNLEKETSFIGSGMRK